VERVAIALRQALDGPDRAARGRGEGRIEGDAKLAQAPAKRVGRVHPARVQRPVEIGGGRPTPFRLGVTQQAQRLHPLSRVDAPTGSSSRRDAVDGRSAPTRAIAASSGRREIAMSAGKARSRRDGVAAESRTKTPRSPWRRISRPKAWASRARTTRSSEERRVGKEGGS